MFTSQTLPNYMEGLAEIVEIGMKARQKGSIYEKFVNTDTTNMITERKQDIEGISTLERWRENAPRSGHQLTEGWPKSFTQVQWAGSAEFSKPTIKFKRKDIVKRMSTALMDAAQKTYEVLGASFLENGDGTPPGSPALVNVTCADGVALFNATHTWRSGQTFGNLNNSGLSITEDNVNTVCTAIRRWKDSAGLPTDVNADQLMIPPDQMLQAYKVLGSRLEPATANNAINVTNKNVFKTEPLVNKYLADAGDWYVLTDQTGDDTSIVFIYGWRDDVTNETEMNKRTGSVYIAIDTSLASGCMMPLRYYKVT